MPIDTPLRRAEERVLLADQLAAELLQIHRQDLAGIGRGERDLLLAAAAVGEDGHEQALAGQQPLAGAEQRAHDAAALLTGCRRRRSSPCAMPRRHVHHRAGFGDRALAGIELDLDELHLAADDLEVDLVRATARHRRWRRRRRPVPAAPPLRYAASCGTSLSGVQFVMPAVKTSVLPSMLPFRGSSPSSCDTGPTWWPPMAMYHCCCAIFVLAPARNRS